MPQFSVKTDNFELFGWNLGKLPNYVQYFGSNNIEGFAESWVEAEMSWLEVDGAGWSWVHGLVIPTLIQYSCFSSTARNLGTDCLIAFCNVFKSVPQSFHTAFIFVFKSFSEMNGSPALPWYTFVFTRSQKK